VAHAVERAVKVDVEAFEPSFPRHFSHRLDLAPSGIVYEDVKPAAVVHRLFHDATNRLEIGDIERQGEKLPAVLLSQLFGKLAAASGVGIRYDDIKAFDSKLLSNGGADARSGCGGDNCDFAI
jgi:hypothetical protein